MYFFLLFGLIAWYSFINNNLVLIFFSSYVIVGFKKRKKFNLFTNLKFVINIIREKKNYNSAIEAKQIN